MSGPRDAPRIVEREADSASGRYLALLAGEVRRAEAAGDLPPVTPRFESLASGGTSIAVQQSLGFGAVFVIFLLTLLLAGQTVSSLAEEKGNKVIEILAAAVPLESEIGRASCRERVWPYVYISVVAVPLKKKIKNHNQVK